MEKRLQLGDAAIRWIRPIFKNNWTDFDANPPGTSANQRVEYCKDPLGFIHLRGLAKRSSGGSTTLPLFTFPKGFRPGNNEVFICHGLTAAPAFATLRVDVQANGDVTVQVGDGSGYTSLAGITFRAER
jgi:hypothetical protein